MYYLLTLFLITFIININIYLLTYIGLYVFISVNEYLNYWNLLLDIDVISGFPFGLQYSYRVTRIWTFWDTW